MREKKDSKSEGISGRKKRKDGVELGLGLRGLTRGGVYRTTGRGFLQIKSLFFCLMGAQCIKSFA